VRAETIIREWLNRRARVPELGERHTVCDWARPEDGPGPWIDEAAYGRLLALLPDAVVTNLEKAKAAQDGRIPMLKAGLGYEECLTSIIVDGSTIASSSTEAFLVPANLVSANYLQPGGIPGRTLVIRARGRHTTLTTAATLTFKVGAALTNVIPTTTWAVSGGITMDTTVQTATMWRVDCSAVVRSVGSAGTVFAMGDASSAAAALTIANQQAQFMGSAGSATPATATVDMTVPQYLGFTGKWSLATAYSITAHRYTLEALN
jgi:hypothetical protein